MQFNIAIIDIKWGVVYIMDIDQTQAFAAIVAHGGFVEAGRHHCLTQLTTSARIRRLEEEIGVPLLLCGTVSCRLGWTGLTGRHL